MTQRRPQLPRRICDNCPTKFQPRVDAQRFCSGNCRKEFHKYGGSFPKLKSVLDEMMKRRIRELSPADTKRFELIELRLQILEDWRKG